MSKTVFDFVVVGAGIVGSWTAKELKNYGKVLLLEQFREPHTRGSSHGQSRLIRSAHAESFFADMMPHAFKMWRQAEAEMNEKLIETTGALCVSENATVKSLKLQSFIMNMKRLCPEHLVEMSGKDIKSKYPTLNYDENVEALFDKSGGVVFAHKAVTTIQKWFLKSGGILWDSCKVSEVIPNEQKVKVVTSKGDVFAKSVVICAGPWTSKLLNKSVSIPLEPQAVKVFYFKEKQKDSYSAESGMPAILGCEHVYSLPSLEYPGLMKVCYHRGVPCNPDERDKGPGDPKFEEAVKSYVKEHFPLLETEPSIVETCMYTCTPDEVYVIDTMPGHKNVVIGAGFSGVGFKTSPAAGRLLGELARGIDPYLDISPYKIARFSSK